jgi:hypothetical protein
VTLRKREMTPNKAAFVIDKIPVNRATTSNVKCGQLIKDVCPCLSLLLLKAIIPKQKILKLVHSIPAFHTTSPRIAQTLFHLATFCPSSALCIHAAIGSGDVPITNNIPGGI